MHYFIKAKSFLMEDHEEEHQHFLEVTDGKFGELFPSVPPDTTVKDFHEYTVGPGLFDTHIHGLGGAEVMDGTQKSFQIISDKLLTIGVTRFLPTTLTAPFEQLKAVAKEFNKTFNQGFSGAIAEGIYFEGPYFTEEHKGAQNPKYFRDPNIDEFHELQNVSGNHIVKLAMAPERKNALKFIKQLSKEHVKVALGHTNANFKIASAAVSSGASIFVHLFNGMRGLHHREPGVVGACLLNKDTFAELICDGHHVCPEIAKLTYGIKKDHTVLITDCMKAGMLPNGNYNLGEFPVIVQDGVARTVNTGSLAGSVLKLIDGVKNIKRWTGIKRYEAWKLGSLVPAISMNLDDHLGSISSGKSADFVVMDDNCNVIETAVNGVVKYKRSATLL